jgi:hypothetical protein
MQTDHLRNIDRNVTVLVNLLTEQTKKNTRTIYRLHKGVVFVLININ